MARTIIVKLTCDRCKADGEGEGVDGEESVSFVYDGYSYGLDLCLSHAEEFHETIQSMITIATTRDRLGITSRRPRVAAAPSMPASFPARGPACRDKEQLQAIRDWANSHGFKVSNRGRIPAEVEVAFEAAFQRSSD